MISSTTKLQISEVQITAIPLTKRVRCSPASLRKARVRLRSSPFGSLCARDDATRDVQPDGSPHYTEPEHEVSLRSEQLAAIDSLEGLMCVTWMDKIRRHVCDWVILLIISMGRGREKSNLTA